MNDDGSGPALTGETYRVNGAHAGALYVPAGGGCEIYPGIEHPPLHMYDLDPTPIADSAFVHLTIVRDP